jgi:uncharacterized membrane protein HdeD (DUF308 family)
MMGLEASTPCTGRLSRRAWFLLLGALLVVLGLAGVGIATALELTSVVIFGPLLLASSILQLVTALFAEERREKVLHFFAAGLELVLGLLIMINPLDRIIGLVALITIFLVAAGLARLAQSLATRSRGRAWFVLTGGVAVLLGISVWLGWPSGKVWFVGLCIALDFLCHGISWSALGWEERSRPAPETHTN